MLIREIFRDYIRSSEFRSLAGVTQKSYGFALDKWEPYLDRDVDEVRSKALAIKIRDELWTAKPGMARLFLACSSAMWTWAMRRGLVQSNPILGIQKPKQGEHKQWPDQVVEKVLKSAPQPIRLACLLGLHTAQRIGDICEARISDVSDGAWNLKQSKTGTALRLPLTREVQESVNWNGEYLLGEKQDSDRLSRLVSKYLTSLGHKDLTYHGLRKVAAARMAERGCTIEELASVTGHKSLSVIQHYIKGADQARMARQAMEKVFG